MEENTSNDAQDSTIEVDFSEEAETQSPVEQETTATAPSTEENKEPEAEKETEAEETDDTSGDAEESEGEETEEKAQPKNKAENRIRTLVSKNRELESQIKALTQQAYPTKSVEQLKDEGYDDTQAQIEALRQENAQKEYAQNVYELTNDLNTESQQVLYELPIFNPDSPEYDKAFAETVSAQYTRVAGIKTDPNTGQIVAANVMPYEFYENMAKIRESGLTKGQIAGKKAAEKQLASAEPASTQSIPKAKSDDPFLDILLKD